MHLILDADPIVYRSGFAAEETHYHIVAETAEGDIREAYFRPLLDAKGNRITAGTQMQEWLADDSITVLEKQRIALPEPVDHALQIVRTELKWILHNVAQEFDTTPDQLQTSILLSGPGNFRDKLATIREYKGNRDPEHKPVHYQAIRNYLTGQWSARVVSGREADDETSILARQHHDEGELDSFVIATIDKDLDQIPGWHYNYMKHVFHYQEPEEADAWFWQQLLAGDQTDNIVGVYGIGPGKAARYVQGWRDEALSAKEIWRRVIDLFAESYSDPDCPYKHMKPRDAALETARLVYMQRRAGELWTPPGAKQQWLEVQVDD